MNFFSLHPEIKELFFVFNIKPEISPKLFKIDNFLLTHRSWICLESSPIKDELKSFLVENNITSNELNELLLFVKKLAEEKLQPKFPKLHHYAMVLKSDGSLYLARNSKEIELTMSWI